MLRLVQLVLGSRDMVTLLPKPPYVLADFVLRGGWIPASSTGYDCMRDIIKHIYHRASYLNACGGG